MPEITILMPAYNCGEFVAESIQSILNQSFEDYELIIMDDGSTDNTLAVIERFDDSRITVQKNKHDFIATLNRGLESVTGRYLARMDADDLIPTERLAIQHAILENHPDIDVCSAWMQNFGKSVNQKLTQNFSGYIEHPLLQMLQTNFVYNATTLCRSAFVKKHNLRYKYYLYAEDYLFWCEAARLGARFFVESQVLYYYRMWENQIGRKHVKEQNESTRAIKKEIVKWLVENHPHEEIASFYDQTRQLNQTGQLTDAAFFELFYQLFGKVIKTTAEDNEPASDREKESDICPKSVTQ